MFSEHWTQLYNHCSNFTVIYWFELQDVVFLDKHDKISPDNFSIFHDTEFLSRSLSLERLNYMNHHIPVYVSLLFLKNRSSMELSTTNLFNKKRIDLSLSTACIKHMISYGFNSYESPILLFHVHFILTVALVIQLDIFLTLRLLDTYNTH